MYFVLKLWPSLCLDPLRQIELSLYDLLFIVSHLMFFYCQRGNNSAIPYKGKSQLYWFQSFFCKLYSPGWVSLGQMTFSKKSCSEKGETWPLYPRLFKVILENLLMKSQNLHYKTNNGHLSIIRIVFHLIK